MSRHALRSGEYLAISPDVVQRDADGFFFLLGPSAPDNERHGTVAVVHVRGALSHYKTAEGDSYEAIVERVGQALADQPSAVVFRIESPGGVVSGLNETVVKLQKMSAEAKVPFIAYVDEMAASAAYAMACACEEILAPPSAVIGSVGVISTMASQVRKDRAEGYDFVLITSGARKADGHLHGEISEAAVSAETKRNTELADQFFSLAGKARGMKPKALAELEAAIYLAWDAKAEGLIDDVASFDEVLLGLGVTETGAPPAVAPNRGNETDRRAAPDQALAQPGTTVPTCDNEDLMPVKLTALIASTTAAIAAEADPKKKSRLAAQLAQYEGTKRAMESDHKEPDGDEDDEGDEDDDESKSEKARMQEHKAAKKAEAAKHRAAAAKHRTKMAEYEEKAKKCMDEAEAGEESGEEDDDAAAVLPMIERGASAAALDDHVTAAQNERIAALEKRIAESDKAKAIAASLHAGEITPATAKMLAGKRPQWVSEYLETTKGMRVVSTQDGHLIVPKDSTVSAATPAAAELAEINARIKSLGITDPAKIESVRNEMIENRRKLEANGVGGRY